MVKVLFKVMGEQQQTKQTDITFIVVSPDIYWKLTTKQPSSNFTILVSTNK